MIKTWQERKAGDKWQMHTVDYMNSEIVELRAENDKLRASLIEYGALCRKQALEEAIDVCVQFGDDYMCQSTTLEIAKEIREQLK